MLSNVSKWSSRPNAMAMAGVGELLATLIILEKKGKAWNVRFNAWLNYLCFSISVEISNMLGAKSGRANSASNWVE